MSSCRLALQQIVSGLVNERKSSEMITEILAVEISRRFPGLSIVDYEALVLAVLDDCGIRVPQSRDRSATVTSVGGVDRAAVVPG